MELLKIDKNEKICIIAPHPDDESIGCGGLMAMYPSQIEVILLTNGRYAINKDGISPLKTADIRKDEFIKVMKLAGINSYICLDYSNGTLMDNVSCLDEIDFSKYSKVFVTSNDDGHYDHTGAAIAVIKAVKNQKNKNTEVFFYADHGPLNHPNCFLDITNVIDKKINYIRLYKSQSTFDSYAIMVKHLGEYRAAREFMYGRNLEEYIRVNIDDINTDPGEERKLQRQELIFRMMSRWLESSVQNINIYEKLPNDVKNIVVYGYGQLGKYLVKDLKRYRYNVAYVMDHNAHLLNSDEVKIIFPKSNVECVDLIIVTVLYEYELVKKNLESMGYKNIIYLKDILDSIDL